MQSQIDWDNEEHSCFDSLKRTVMGCCYSLCHKDRDSQEPGINERTYLLPTAEETPPPRATLPAPAPRHTDEHSALSRILHDAANNVIDVGALGPHTLEPHEYNERVRTYQARLTNINASSILTQPRLLKDIPQGEKTAMLTAEPVSNADRDLILNAVKKATAAMSDLRVDHREDLVVPFKIP